MTGYLSYFKVRVIAGLQYKTAAIAGFCTNAFWGLMNCLIYMAFYRSAKLPSIGLKEIVCYVWLHQAFLVLTYVNDKDTDILNSITDGTVAYELVRPYRLYVWWYLKLYASKLSGCLLRFIPVLLLGFLMPNPIKLSLPYNFMSLLLFIVSLILGTILLCGILMIIHSIAFYTINYRGIFNISSNFIMLLSGFVLPVPLLPDIVQKVTYYMPFRLLGDLSYRVYSGNIPVTNALFDILLQVIWIVIIIIIGYSLMRKALKKVFIQGG